MADLAKGIGNGTVVARSHFAQCLAAFLVRAERGKVVILLPTRQLAPMNGLELGCWKPERFFGESRCGRAA
jgi:hypothetical protein